MTATCHETMITPLTGVLLLVHRDRPTLTDPVRIGETVDELSADRQISDGINFGS